MRRPKRQVGVHATTRWCLAASIVVLATLVVAAPRTEAASGTGERIEADRPTHKGSYDVRSVLTLGGPNAPEEQQFYEKYERLRVDADAAGNVYVLDGGNVRIQVFDAEGRWLRSIGSEGEGPGEFKLPARLSVNASGDCAVFDMSAMRISIFDANGDLVRDQVAGRPVRDLHLNDDRTLVCTLMMPGSSRVVAYGTDGKELWSYGEGASPSGGRMINIENGADHMATRLCSTADGGILLTSNDEYWLRLIHDGEASYTFTRPFTRREFQFAAPSEDEEDGDNVQVVMIRRGPGEGGDDSPGGVEVQAGGHDGEEMTFNGQELRNMMPKFAPDLRGSLAWRDGRIWALTGENEGDRIVVDEWGGDGEYVRRFTLRQGYDWLELGADGKLYAVTHDEDDYPIVHRLDVTTLE